MSLKLSNLDSKNKVKGGPQVNLNSKGITNWTMSGLVTRQLSAINLWNIQLFPLLKQESLISLFNTTRLNPRGRVWQCHYTGLDFAVLDLQDSYSSG
jgi:hypothetical protein